MPTTVTITAPQYNSDGSVRESSATWWIAFDDDGLHVGHTSFGLLPERTGQPANKDGVLLALAREVHRLRNEVPNHRTHADVTPDGSLVTVGPYEIHGEPGRVTLHGGLDEVSFDRGSVTGALQQAAREIRRLRGAPPAAVPTVVIPRQSRERPGNPFHVLNVDPF